MNIWNMQLHPHDSDNWSNNDIKKILDFGLIGCSGAPITTFNKIIKGDIIFIRHKNKEAIALVEALENPRDTLSNEYNNYVWFDRCVSIKILEIYENEKIPGEGFFFPSTIAQIGDKRALTYVEGLYQNYLNKQQEAKMQTHINILLQKKQIILQGAPGTGKTRLAQIIAQELTKDGGETQLIQFHPAYSYEDFVRGIVAETNENGQINYKVQNKILAEMAQKAKENLDDSQKTPEILEKETKEKTLFENFKDYCLKIDIYNFNLAENEEKQIFIVGSDDKGFWYKGINWNNQNKMNFEDIRKMYNANVSERKDLLKIEKLSRVAKEHSSYFLKILGKFREFLHEEKQDSKTKKDNPPKEIPLKNYVLIIDEINRANLPAVLGELIYALEYRGKPVNSLYAIEGNREIILPENLYIIGTMNTADRSVGHIDYAIRRRFAFISVPPNKNVIKDKNAKELFKQIKTIFEKNLSADFANAIDDIMIGHSYFLVEDYFELETKLDYEIKPLLREYVKDGILTCEMEIIDALKLGTYICK